jgi:pimeloyl-ACP methyl ester carboxylesterase
LLLFSLRQLHVVHRLILIDARGHGASDKPHDPDAYELNRRVADVVAVLDALDIAKALFWGYSMGGWIGFGIAKYAKERVRALVIGGQQPYARSMESLRHMVRSGIAQGSGAFVAGMEEMLGPESAERKGRLLSADIEAYLALTLRVRASKSGRPRHVVLTQEGRDFVAQLAMGKPGSMRLFLRSNGKGWAKSEQQRPLSAACAAARIDPAVNFHSLRHIYASRLAMRGAPLAVIAKQLGHADTRMVEKHYGHLAPSYVADTVRAAFGSLGIVDQSNVVRIAATR